MKTAASLLRDAFFLLIISNGLSGCLAPSAYSETPGLRPLEPQELPTETCFTGDTGVAALGYGCIWNITRSSLNFVLIEFTLPRQVKYVVDPRPTASWYDARIQYEQRLILENGTFKNQYFAAYPTCGPEHTAMKDCPRQDLDHVGGGRANGTIGPGVMHFLYAVYGADKMALDLLIAFNESVEVASAEIGRADLIPLLDEGHSGRANEDRAWEIELQLERPAVVAVHPMRTELDALDVQTGRWNGTYKAVDVGWMAPPGWFEPTTPQILVPGPAGTWRFEAHVADAGRPGAVLLGVLWDPFVVQSDGAMHRPPWF